MKPFLTSAVQWTIWFVSMTLIMGWWSKSRQGKSPGSEPQVLRHTHVALIVGIVTTLLFGGFTVLVVVSEQPVEAPTYLVLLAFCCLGVYFLAEFFAVRFAIDDRGMDYRTPWRGSGRLSWSEVRSIRYSPMMKWFLLKTHAGKTLRVPATLAGLSEFARLCLTRTNPGVIEKGSLRVLEETSAGHLPALWIQTRSTDHEKPASDSAAGPVATLGINQGERMKKTGGALKDVGPVVLVIVAAVIAGALGREFVVKGFAQTDPTSREVLMRAANEINKMAPRMVDTGIELTGAIALDGVIIYNYRLVDHAAADLDVQVLYENLQPGIVNAVCTTPETRNGLIDPGVIMRYRYYDKSSVLLTTVDVAKADCTGRKL